ncbi:hypothetical protein EJB05_37618, partial [Eragrostis curvula]
MLEGEGCCKWRRQARGSNCITCKKIFQPLPMQFVSVVLVGTKVRVSSHTGDFLASCAVVVSSLLPPFARTIEYETQLSNATSKIAK